MNDQSNNQNRSSNNQRRHHHRRRHNHNRPRPEQAPQASGQSQASDSTHQGQNNRRRFHKPHHNRPRPGQGQPGSNQQSPSINLDRIYEKYLNLLDQHLIARRKYHDLFYRADPAQKVKLEKNFYHSLNELNDFKDKLAPSARELFEKRNNGLSLDVTYTTNHQLPAEAEAVSTEGEWEDPHYLQSQKMADYSGDTEESVGSIDDYLNYKNQH